MFKKLIIIQILILFGVLSLYSQTETGVNCGMSTVSSLPSTPFGMGLSKPMKSPPTSSSDAYFRVMMVFIEFAGETEESAHWKTGSLPDYSGSLFAPEKELGINAYSDYAISNYFNKISNDQFDVIGDVYHVVLDHDYIYYTTHGGLAQAQTDAFSILDNVYEVNWELYDLWQWNSSTQQYEQSFDNYIDMIYTQYRKIDAFGFDWGGYGTSLVNYTTRDSKHITDEGISYHGTGVSGLDGANMSITDAIGLFRHEYCHYTLGNHVPYSTILGGDGSSTVCGSEVGFSPQDLITVGLANVTTYSGSVHSFNLDDMATTGDVLKVPNGTSGESFLVSNRRRIAGNGTYTWDCNMVGDTAMGSPFSQFGDFSKGLYIYHVSGGDDFQPWADQESADGLWDWEENGTDLPDWSSSQTLPVLKKTGVGHNDDNPLTSYSSSDRFLSRDGQSVIAQSSDPYAGWGQKWFSVGKKHTTIGEKGTDRIWANELQNWTSRELQGDRWDAWRTGYNEVFSPYSSPNTKNRANENTGIFIYYPTLSSDVATVKVYQGAFSTTDEATALENTPPSRPMLYRPIQIADCNGTYGFPQITWDNNMEPDMLRSGTYKRYKIYRAKSTVSSVVPSTYSYIGYYDDYTPSDTANFIDNNSDVGIYCGSSILTSNDTYYRYKISAVDNTEWESVKSDFVAIKGIDNLPDNPGVIENNNPEKFSLYQNYPNPFNPSTQIKYDLPQSSFVTIKIYNAIGQEVAELVNNEFKSAGRYSVNFNASNLSSGIYFYSIKAGAYNDTKKMVLIK